ncbi:MAG: DUF3368 domain-containing protein [Acidobacteriota bacterium]
MDIVGQLPLEFICPREVRFELDQGVTAGYPQISPSWLNVVSLSQPPSPAVLAGLDLGEAAVIQLALDQAIPQVAIDDWKGRRAALAADLRVTGSLGILGRAKLSGLIPSLRPLIERAVERGIRYHPELVQTVLEATGE